VHTSRTSRHQLLAAAVRAIFRKGEAHVCAALGLSRIAVWGISGGGPYALATAALLPGLVVAVASLAGPAPYDADGLDWFDGMGKDNADGFRLRLTDPAAARAEAEAERKMVLAASTADLAEGLSSLFSPVDAAAFTGELADYVMGSFREALAPGIEGWQEDQCAEISPWGFEVASISVPVLVVHGQQDQFAPFGHGRWLAAHIPGAQAWLREDDGHWTPYEYRVPEVHAWLSDRFSSH
jgi:pimeloyl-ACP methyl ester carboxylesterase